MSIEIVKSLLMFFGGTAMFIYGMQVMADGLQQAAGEKTRRMLEILTNNRLLGVLVGAAVTAIIQSSGATTVMVVGFVNAHLMSLEQAVGVIMGANIGTTATAWIVSLSEWGTFLKPDMLAPFLLAMGVVLHMLLKTDRGREGANILIGFGLLFMGLSTMSSTVTPYADSPIFLEIFRVIGGNPLLGLLVGALVTAIMQSSSASMGILQTLALTGIVNWGSAVFIALGQNIGTCVVALISSIGADTNAKRAAAIHLEFNVLGSAIVGIAAFIFFMMFPSYMHLEVSSTNLALFHTSFNVVSTLLLFPFAGYLVKLSRIIVPGHDDKESHVVHLDSRLLANSAVALEAMQQELTYMAQISISNIAYARDTLVDHTGFEELQENEEKIDRFYSEISQFAQQIQTTTLTDKEKVEYRHAILALRDLEHISDRCIEIANMAKNHIAQLNFSEESIEMINTFSSDCEEMMNISLLLKSDYSMELVDDAKRLQKKIFKLDQLSTSRKFEEGLDTGENTVTAMIFLEVVDRFERIANHARLLCHYPASEKGTPIKKLYTSGEMN